MSCPSQDCHGTRPEQCDLAVSEKAAIDAPAWAERALVCSCCGCVYTREDQDYPLIRGWLNNRVAGRGWKASRSL